MLIVRIEPNLGLNPEIAQLGQEANDLFWRTCQSKRVQTVALTLFAMTAIHCGAFPATSLMWASYAVTLLHDYIGFEQLKVGACIFILKLWTAILDGKMPSLDPVIQELKNPLTLLKLAVMTAACSGLVFYPTQILELATRLLPAMKGFEPKLIAALYSLVQTFILAKGLQAYRQIQADKTTETPVHQMPARRRRAKSFPTSRHLTPRA